MCPTEDITWPIELCQVCEQPVSLFDDRGFMSLDEGGYVHHLDTSEERTCFELLLDSYADLWAQDNEEPFLVNGDPWTPGETRAVSCGV